MARIVTYTLVSVLLLVFISCSDSSPGRVDVWGAAKFKNQPVRAGLIVINPDLSKGNDGPQGLAEIRDGRFDTRKLDKGAPKGPVVFLIDGFDGVPHGESPSGKPLFLGYKVSMELAGASEKNIDVPDSAAATAKAGFGPLP